MVMTNLQAMLKSILLFNSNPKIIVTKINEMLCDTLLDGMFITLIVGFLDSVSGELEYVNAGHELPVLITNTGQVKQLGEPANMPLGVVKSEYVVQYHTLLPNDGLLIVSDGITETLRRDSQLFGVERLLRTVSKSSQCNCQQIVDSVVNATSMFRGTLPQNDDSTILSLKLKAQ
jgi:sigma-B regulation protein RsbU (phosphoserine phosphatase)